MHFNKHQVDCRLPHRFCGRNGNSDLPFALSNIEEFKANRATKLSIAIRGQAMHAAMITTARNVGRAGQDPQVAPATVLFAGVLLFVGAVSVYDGYLVIRTGAEIREFEKNPVGLCLIECNHGDPTLFLIAKGVGTAVVLTSLTLLYRRSQRMAFPVAYALLVFQAGLLIFLERA